jgi:hypothetical protein
VTSSDKKSPKTSLYGKFVLRTSFSSFDFFEFGREFIEQADQSRKKQAAQAELLIIESFLCHDAFLFLNKKRAPLIEQSQGSFDLIGLLLLLKTNRGMHIRIGASEVSKKMFLDIHGLSTSFLRVGT